MLLYQGYKVVGLVLLRGARGYLRVVALVGNDRPVHGGDAVVVGLPVLQSLVKEIVVRHQGDARDRGQGEVHAIRAPIHPIPSKVLLLVGLPSHLDVPVPDIGEGIQGRGRGSRVHEDGSRVLPGASSRPEVAQEIVPNRIVPREPEQHDVVGLSLGNGKIVGEGVVLIAPRLVHGP